MFGKIRPQIFTAIMFLGVVALGSIFGAISTGNGEIFIGLAGMAITGMVALAKDIISGDAG